MSRNVHDWQSYDDSSSMTVRRAWREARGHARLSGRSEACTTRVERLGTNHRISRCGVLGCDASRQDIVTAMLRLAHLPEACGSTRSSHPTRRCDPARPQEDHHGRPATADRCAAPHPADVVGDPPHQGAATRTRDDHPDLGEVREELEAEYSSDPIAGADDLGWRLRAAGRVRHRPRSARSDGAQHLPRCSDFAVMRSDQAPAAGRYTQRCRGLLGPVASPRHGHRTNQDT
jgi:hypothetical protein